MPETPATLCRHFGTCGGCALQDIADAEYLARKRAGVVRALERHRLAATVGAVVSVPPGTRRRAVFKARRLNGATTIGFHAAASHTIVDMLECQVLTPALVELAGGLRHMMQALLRDGDAAELHVTQAANGFDIAIRWQTKVTPRLIAEIAQWSAKLGIVRITSGTDIVTSLAPPELQIGRATVRVPPGAFLQPTLEGEQALQDAVAEMLSGAKTVADLFAGCGTFSLRLAEKARVHAVELDGRMLEALAAAARNTSGLKPVSIEKRDLFRRPLSMPELGRYDAVSLDPPRAGALEQSRQLAASRVGRIAYVSCNAETFARDARILVDGGFRLDSVVPVDQFLWSEHIELAGLFER